MAKSQRFAQENPSLAVGKSVPSLLGLCRFAAHPALPCRALRSRRFAADLGVNELLKIRPESLAECIAF